MKTEFIVVDGFYDDPYTIRNMALNLSYTADDRYFKGHRSFGKHLPAGTQFSFAHLLGKPVTKWDYDVNGCFQFCTPEDKIVYHMDGQKYAAAVYLTPNAPPECGLSLYRSKHTGIRGCPTRDGVEGDIADGIITTTFSDGFYDKTKFELIDKVGNVFNRLVIWDAKLIHAASEYFGTKKEDARLFQMFFFDA